MTFFNLFGCVLLVALIAGILVALFAKDGDVPAKFQKGGK